MDEHKEPIPNDASRFTTALAGIQSELDELRAELEAADTQRAATAATVTKAAPRPGV